MIEIKKLIKCDKCGSTKVVVETPPPEIQIVVETMDEYIKNNKVSSSFISSSSAWGNKAITLNLRCPDCGFIRPFEQTRYQVCYG